MILQKNKAGQGRRLSLALLVFAGALLLFASSASALQIGVDWSGKWEQSQTTSEWNVIQHSGSGVYRVMLWKDKWGSGNCSPSACTPCTVSRCDAYDPIFRHAAEANVSILPYFFNGGYPQSGEPAYEQWYAFIKEVVKRYGYSGAFWQENPSLNYKPVTAWELGNEPNLSGENQQYGQNGVVSPTRYGNFLVYMSNAVRSASSEQSGQGTTVLMAGLYMGPVGSGSMGWETFLSQAYNVSGFYSAFDGISIHPYGFDYAHTVAANKTIGESTGEITAIRNLLAGKTWGPSRSLWITEIGWPVGWEGNNDVNGATRVDEANQSRLLTESFNWVKNHQGVQGQSGNNKIESLIWYNLRDDNSNSEWLHHDGLLKGDTGRGARPAWSAFQSQTGAAAWTPPAEQAPGVTTESATEVQSSQATLHGTVNPQGLPTTYRFEYGTTTSFGSSAPVPDGSAGEGEGAVAQSAVAAGLEPGATYYYRIVASNALGTSYGSTSTFTTPMALKPAVIYRPNGDKDIFFRGNDGQLKWWEWNAAKSTWTLQWVGSTGAMAGDPVPFEDTNGDLDVFYRATDGQLHWWWWNAAKGSWSQQWMESGFKMAGDPAVFKDTNGDLDVFYRATNGQLHWWWWNAAKGSWSQQWLGSENAIGGEPTPIKDSENGLEVYYRNNEGHVAWWWWHPGAWTLESLSGADTGGCTKRTGPAGYFATPSAWGSLGSAYSLNFADVNGDCRADLIGRSSATGDRQVSLSNGSGFSPSTSWGAWSPEGTISFMLADVNGDGKADSVGRNSSTAEVRAGLSTGATFNASTSWGTWSLSYSVAFADVNGDGRADIIGRNSNGNVQVGLSTGSTFAASTSWTSWSTAYSMELADVNGDGRADLVGRNSAGNVQVGLSTGSSFAASTSWTSWSTAYSMELADVNADGLADLVGRNSAGDIQVGLSAASFFRGSTSWGTWSISTAPLLADANDDGRADILGRDSTGNVKVGRSTPG